MRYQRFAQAAEAIRHADSRGKGGIVRQVLLPVAVSRSLLSLRGDAGANWHGTDHSAGYSPDRS